MKAIRTHEPAGISGLVFEEVPDPTPTIGDVLVKVAACGLTHNELDWPLRTCRNGHQRDSIIPAQEVSGVVTALGMGTAGIAVGDEVFGLTDPYRDAAAAEYVAVEARNVAPKPQTVDHVHAAAVPRAGLTAWQALFDHGKLAKGQTVVIHGGGKIVEIRVAFFRRIFLDPGIQFQDFFGRPPGPPVQLVSIRVLPVVAHRQ